MGAALATALHLIGTPLVIAIACGLVLSMALLIGDSAVRTWREIRLIARGAIPRDGAIGCAMLATLGIGGVLLYFQTA